MKTNLIIKYRKHFVLMLFLSLNFCINFTHNNFSIGIKHMIAQETGESWDYGVEWLDDLLDATNFTPGTYFNQGDGNWSFCTTCAAHVNMEEIVAYGVKPIAESNPVDLDESDLWWDIPTDNVPANDDDWKSWGYSEEDWSEPTDEIINDDATSCSCCGSLFHFNCECLDLFVPTTCISNSAQSALDYVNLNYLYEEAACNIGVQESFYELSNSLELYYKNANAMVAYWATSPLWEEILMSAAQGEANSGCFVVAGRANPIPTLSGHVVTIVPGDEVSISTWGCNVPVAMDTGPSHKWVKKGINYSWLSAQKDQIKFYKYIGSLIDCN